MSVINLFLFISLDDPEEKFNQKEIDYLNRYIDFLGLNQQKCNAYLQSGGQQKIIYDLKYISILQKEFLIIAVYDMLTIVGKRKTLKSTYHLKYLQKLELVKKFLLLQL